MFKVKVQKGQSTTNHAFNVVMPTATAITDEVKNSSKSKIEF